MLEWLKTPAAGTAIGALLLIAGGIITVSGAATPGTLVAAGGFWLILKFRILPARHNRKK